MANYEDVPEGALDFLTRKKGGAAAPPGSPDAIAWNKKFVEFIKDGGTQKMLKTFNAKTSSNFGFAYRKYLIKDVQQLRMIEYAEWPYISFYNPKNAFRGINQLQMHKLYYKSK